MKYATKNKAAHAWVNEFDRVPYGIIEKLLKHNPDELYEITPPSLGDRVYSFDYHEYGEITETALEVVTVELDNGETVDVDPAEIEVHRDDFLPMWGTLWAFSDSCDNYWIEELGGFKQWRIVVLEFTNRKIIHIFSALMAWDMIFSKRIGSPCMKRAA